MTDLSISMNWKDNNHDLSIIIIDFLINMIYYTLIKTIINKVPFVEMIINIIIRHYIFLESIIYDQSLLFILKF